MRRANHSPLAEGKTRRYFVWLAGQHGMVGGAMMRRLERERCVLLRDFPNSDRRYRIGSGIDHRHVVFGGTAHIDPRAVRTDRDARVSCPTSIVATILFVAVSITETVPPPPLLAT